LLCWFLSQASPLFFLLIAPLLQATVYAAKRFIMIQQKRTTMGKNKCIVRCWWLLSTFLDDLTGKKIILFVANRGV
jgi:hypothetical protein